MAEFCFVIKVISDPSPDAALDRIASQGTRWARFARSISGIISEPHVCSPPPGSSWRAISSEDADLLQEGAHTYICADCDQYYLAVD